MFRIRHSPLGGPSLFASLALSVLIWIGFLKADSPAEPESNAEFAVVELFTSEGCSSCPAADAALAELIKNSAGKPVYALAFHVDYWDGLGWPDRFASAAFTQRQRTYALGMKLNGLYTPQAIVNGVHEFVGSNREKLKEAVAIALDTPPTGTVSAVVKSMKHGLAVSITTVGLPAETVIHAALVEDGLTSEVRAGENRGRTLPHEHVVRAFVSTVIDKDGNATAELSIPADLRPARSKVILFSQQATDPRILAATEVAFPK